ncbi:MAG: threonine/serine exporter family protein [Phycisphaerales bacterium]|nr:threonine/serine exporter family protein [Phycisphaerales bacterium]
MSDDAIRFLTRLGQALNTYGTPAHRLEDALRACADALGLEAQVFSTPTSLHAAFGTPPNQRPVLLRIEPGDANLEKLVDLDRVFNDVCLKRLDVAAGLEVIDAILARRPRYGQVWQVGMLSLASACAATLLGGAVEVVLLVLVNSLVVGLLLLISRANRHLSRVVEFAAGAFAGSVAQIEASIFGFDHATTFLVTLATVIVILPGLTVTVAATELATRNLVSGTARLMGAGMILMSVVFGVAIGLRLGSVLEVTPGEVTEAPTWMWILALLLAPVSFGVLFQARPRDLALISVTCIAGFGGARLGAVLFDFAELGVGLGAFVVGAAANVYARWRDRPAVVLSVPGIMLLVPGAVGFRGITALLEQDAVGGVQTIFSMLVVAASLVGGLLIANATVPPRKAL